MHRIGHPQRRLGRGGGGEIDPDLELARRLARDPLQPRDLAIDLALLALGIADRGIGGGDFLRDRGKGRTPFGDRPRLALVADARRRRFGELLGEFAARGGGRHRAFQIVALVLQRLDALVEFGQIVRRGARRPGSIDPIVILVAASPSTRSEEGSSVSGNPLAPSELSPAARST